MHVMSKTYKTSRNQILSLLTELKVIYDVFFFSYYILHDSVRNLSSPQCKNINVMRLFNNTQRRKRSFGHRTNIKPSYTMYPLIHLCK